MQKEEDTNGLNIYKVKGWDYAGMCEVFEEGFRMAGKHHIPVFFMWKKLLSHRVIPLRAVMKDIKRQERLEWEREWDCLKKMKEWIIENALSDEEELEEIERNAKKDVKESKDSAWEKYLGHKAQVEKAVELINSLATGITGKSGCAEKNSQRLSVKPGAIEEGCNESAL